MSIASNIPLPEETNQGLKKIPQCQREYLFFYFISQKKEILYMLSLAMNEQNSILFTVNKSLERRWKPTIRSVEGINQSTIIDMRNQITDLVEPLFSGQRNSKLRNAGV